MPVIKSAIKKLKQDKKRQKDNDALEIKANQALRYAKNKANGKSVAEAIALVDKMAKKKIIHKNKASRLKISLSKIAKPISAKVKSAPKANNDSKISKKPAKKASK